jgi:hypothetical protein
MKLLVTDVVRSKGRNYAWEKFEPELDYHMDEVGNRMVEDAIYATTSYKWRGTLSNSFSYIKRTGKGIAGVSLVNPNPQAAMYNTGQGMGAAGVAEGSSPPVGNTSAWSGDKATYYKDHKGEHHDISTASAGYYSKVMYAMNLSMNTGPQFGNGGNDGYALEGYLDEIEDRVGDYLADAFDDMMRSEGLI